MRQDEGLVPVVGTEEQVQKQLDILAEQREEIITAGLLTTRENKARAT